MVKLKIAIQIEPTFTRNGTFTTVVKVDVLVKLGMDAALKS